MLAFMANKDPGPQFYLCPQCLRPTINGFPPCDSCGCAKEPIPLRDTHGLSLDDLSRFSEHAFRMGDYFANVRTRWVKDFNRRVVILLQEKRPTEDDAALFWVRLHGVLTELIEHLEPMAALYDRMTPDEIREYTLIHGAPVSRLKGCKMALAFARAIHGTLTDEEHVYADWQRQLQCHLGQHAFQVHIQGDPGNRRKLKDSSKIKATDKPVTVDERWSAIQKVLRAHGNDDVSVAIAIARRIEDHADRMTTAWTQFVEPNAPAAL